VSGRAGVRAGGNTATVAWPVTARVTLQQNATLTNAAVGVTSGLTVTTASGTSRVTIPQGDGESALPAE
jgi:hypothetical protein